jgi:hypothetical protein
LMARRMLSSSTNESQSSDSDRSDAEGSSIAGSENRDDTDTDESEASDTLDGSEDAMEESLPDVLSGRYYVIVIPERDGYPGASSRRFAGFSSAVYFMYYGCVLSYETSTRNYTDFIQTRRQENPHAYLQDPEIDDASLHRATAGQASESRLAVRVEELLRSPGILSPSSRANNIKCESSLSPALPIHRKRTPAVRKRPQRAVKNQIEPVASRTRAAAIRVEAVAKKRPAEPFPVTTGMEPVAKRTRAGVAEGEPVAKRTRASMAAA